jgi:intracellular sulfur oxidation DsrE/DsrF family protein
VFSVAALSFVGDLPWWFVHLQIITGDIADWGATSEVVVVFHGDAGHVTLNDAAYNADRNIETGNPYKDLVANLMSRGVHVELCGATARARHYGNEDGSPGSSTQAVHMRRLARDGREMPCRPYVYDAARWYRKHAANDPLITPQGPEGVDGFSAPTVLAASQV